MTAATSLQLYPATIGWVPEIVEPTKRGFQDQYLAEPFSQIVFGAMWSKRPRFPAWRCPKCRLVIFVYPEDDLA